MSKREKFKKFVNKTLFGEKLELALNQKSNEPSESKHTKPVSQPAAVDKSKLEPEEDIRKTPVDSKVKKDDTTSRDVLRESNGAEFLQIMERRFAKGLEVTNPRINLGIDLGTSFSKVVWRLGENSYPVCFGRSQQNLEDYLIPSTVSFGAASIMSGADASQERSKFTIGNFKMCLACESQRNDECHIRKCSLTRWPSKVFSELEGEEAAFVVAFYLAKLLHRTKQVVTSELVAKGFRQPFEARWTANLAVPEKFVEESPVSTTFAKVFKIAWLMSEVFNEIPGLNGRQKIFECFLAAKALAVDLTRRLHDQGKDFDCFIYPEIGAEVASIILSRTSDEGLYAFVDIGAGTVDASVFRFWRDGGETNRPPYAARIFKIGAAHIETRSNKKFLKSSADWLRSIKEGYGSLTDKERVRFLDSVVSLLEETSREIQEEAYRHLVEVFREAFSKEPGTEKEGWQNLKLILGGGGARLNVYKDAATSAFSLKDSKKPKQPETTILPRPNDFYLGGLRESDFHRFAVAYGLSHDIVNLPEVIFASDVKSIRQPLPHSPKNADWYEK